ncbi:MAG TPA: tetratricopeptide repeat protein, partial [Polyangiaceae bacterium]
RDSPHTPEDFVQALGSGLTGARSKTNAIISARPSARLNVAEPSAFTHLWQLVLDWQPPGVGVSARGLFEAMRAEQELFEDIPAAGYFAGARDLWLVPPAAAESMAYAAGAGDALGAFDAPFGAAPTFAGLIAAGDRQAERRQFDAALGQYEGARAFLSEKPGPDHLTLYAKIASALRTVARREDAAAYYEAALAIDPDHMASLDGVTELYLELGNAERARAWLARWAAVDPKALVAQERLLSLQLSAGEHVAALDTRRRLAHALPDPSRAAAQLVAAGVSAQEVIGDEARALALYEEALHFAPADVDALGRLEQLLGGRRQFARLAEIFEYCLERVADAELARALARQLADLCRDELRDERRAALAMARLARLDPSNRALQNDLTTLFVQQGDFEKAAEQARAAIVAEPAPAALRLALSVFERNGDSDAAWNAANALDFLGEADINESLVASQHRPEGLLAARTSLRETDWLEGHLYPDKDEPLTQLIFAMREAALEVGLAAAQKRHKSIELDPSALQDPQKSTTTLAKTLVWTARLLGVKTPELYVMPEAPGDLSAVPLRSAASVASRSVGSGLGLPQLAFLWGRHLVQYRPDHELLVFFPALADLSALLSAVLAVGGSPRVQMRALEGDAKRFASGLKKHLRGAHLEHVKALVLRQPDVDPSTRMRAYQRRVELASLRAGLLACGSVEIAVPLAERFRFGTLQDAKAQRAELLSFSVSRSYGELRRRLGVAVA